MKRYESMVMDGLKYTRISDDKFRAVLVGKEYDQSIGENITKKQFMSILKDFIKNI